MQDIHHDESRPNRVRVAFEEGALSFMLSKDATFEDLADRLRDLDERHHGIPSTTASTGSATSSLLDSAWR